MSQEQESFTLLRLSDESDSLSDVPEIIVNPRKKKVRRSVCIQKHFYYKNVFQSK